MKHFWWVDIGRNIVRWASPQLDGGNILDHPIQENNIPNIILIQAESTKDALVKAKRQRKRALEFDEQEKSLGRMYRTLNK